MCKGGLLGENDGWFDDGSAVRVLMWLLAVDLVLDPVFVSLLSTRPSSHVCGWSGRERECV